VPLARLVRSVLKVRRGQLGRRVPPVLPGRRVLLGLLVRPVPPVPRDLRVLQEHRVFQGLRERRERSGLRVLQAPLVRRGCREILVLPTAPMLTVISTRHR